MYIDSVPNRKSPPTVLLRKTYREGKRVKKKTIANISDWDEELIVSFDKLLKGAKAIFPDEVFSIKRSLPHGHIELIYTAIKKLGLDTVLSSRPCRERSLVLAMIINQLIYSDSKLSSISRWENTTITEQLGVKPTDEDELYEAMDWLYERIERIENKLAKRHLQNGCHMLYDISSSYYEGHSCSLIQYGHNRDNKKGKKIIVYGMLTSQTGCPIAIEVYPGNTSDPKTVIDQVEKMRKRFKLEKIILVGDRGMLTQTQLDKLKEYPGIGWITALRSEAIRQLVEHQHIQLSLFDEQNIAEIQSELFPGERLVVCHNPIVEEYRRNKREDLLQATEKHLEKIKKQVQSRKKKQLSATEISMKVGRVIDKHKMKKHFILTIEDGHFSYCRNEQTIKQEASLDGIYIVRTNQPAEVLSYEDVVRSYKDLSKVEKVFRTMKSVDIRVRPIRHRLEERVKSHIFICMLAYYVEWHLRKMLASLIFDDEELENNRKTRDAVASPCPSQTALRKKRLHYNEDNLPVQSFASLLDHMATKTWNICEVKQIQDKKYPEKQPTFIQISDMTPVQKRALELVQNCTQYNYI